MLPNCSVDDSEWVDWVLADAVVPPYQVPAFCFQDKVLGCTRLRYVLIHTRYLSTTGTLRQISVHQAPISSTFTSCLMLYSIYSQCSRYLLELRPYQR